MGILPLRLPSTMHPTILQLTAGDRIEIDGLADSLHPRCEIPVRLHRATGEIETFTAMAAIETQLETELLRHGGVLPYILQKTIAAQRKS
jgi:aconitate hydratase